MFKFAGIFNISVVFAILMVLSIVKASSSVECSKPVESSPSLYTVVCTVMTGSEHGLTYSVASAMSIMKFPFDVPANDSKNCSQTGVYESQFSYDCTFVIRREYPSGTYIVRVSTFSQDFTKSSDNIDQKDGHTFYIPPAKISQVHSIKPDGMEPEDAPKISIESQSSQSGLQSLTAYAVGKFEIAYMAVTATNLQGNTYLFNESNFDPPLLKPFVTLQCSQIVEEGEYQVDVVVKDVKGITKIFSPAGHFNIW